jgi:hypothetical protein
MRVSTPPVWFFDRYIEIWNETDDVRRGELIAQTWADDATNNETI